MIIKGSYFVVTGGSRGLGKACVDLLSQNGAKILSLSKSGSEVNNPNVLSLSCDVTDIQQIKSALTKGRESFGELQGVIHCAGIGGNIKLGTDSEQLQKINEIINININGTFNVINAVSDELKKSEVKSDGERGVIIMTSSIAATEGQRGQSAYASSKGAIDAMTLPMSRELAKDGIRVMTIAPGIFETDIIKGKPEELISSLYKDTFPKRLGNPDEFASLAEHILTNKMLNGSILRLDGGVRL